MLSEADKKQIMQVTAHFDGIIKSTGKGCLKSTAEEEDGWKEAIEGIFCPRI